MSVSVSAAEAFDVRKKALSALSRAKSVLSKTDEQVNTVVHATVTAGTAFAFGVVQGRYGGVEVAGVPADLGAGIVLHAMGFMGIGGKASEYMHAAGNGALACYLAALGRGVGGEWRNRTLASGGASAPGLPAAAAGQTISDAELARMARGGA